MNKLKILFNILVIIWLSLITFKIVAIDKKLSNLYKVTTIEIILQNEINELIVDKVLELDKICKNRHI